MHTERPAATVRRPGLAPGLRSLTGVDEEILSTIPSERPRYTAMGGVVLGTAVIAMFSMSVALYFVFGRLHPLAFAFVPIWGAFVLCLDRWLMSINSPNGRSLRRLLPRLLLAMALGVIVAEPLLLGIFQTAIEERVRDDRLAEVRDHESLLRTCNPVPGTAEAARGEDQQPRCAGARLGVVSESEAHQEALDDANQQAASLRTTIDKDAEAYAALEQKAGEECNGTEGAGLTGLFGEGPNCDRLRLEASRYRADHRIDENNQKLADLNDTIAELTTKVGGSRADTAQRIDAAISKNVQDLRDNQKDEIGLLERMAGLSALSSENGYVLAGEWAMRVFFIIVDSLPVFLKIMSGQTPYDRIVGGRLQSQERAQQAVSETERRTTVLREELERYQQNAEHAARRRKIDVDARLRYLEEEVQLERLTDVRADYLLAEAPTMLLPRYPAAAGWHHSDPPAPDHRTVS